MPLPMKQALGHITPTSSKVIPKERILRITKAILNACGNARVDTRCPFRQCADELLKQLGGNKSGVEERVVFAFLEDASIYEAKNLPKAPLESCCMDCVRVNTPGRV